ncbi:MAG: hypothetical protein FJX44_03560 [Alphaproteobacteria bacterium]|nr:hypothetical protein [Alphaproteobacteria bacterium]
MLRLIAVFIALVAGPAAAQAEVRSACKDLLGTYLTTNTAKNGSFTSRSLLSFGGQGLVLFADSGQSGEHGFASFTDSRGAWRCVVGDGGKVKVKATTLDFTASADGSEGKIGRLDFDLDYLTDQKTIAGTATLFFVPLDADPFAADQLKDGLQFDISGQRVEAP